MGKKAPGRANRKGLTLVRVADMFRNEETAEAWVANLRWPHGPHCPECGSFRVQSGIKHRTMTHRCRDCAGKPFFSLRKRTIMESSKLSYRAWAIGIYLFGTNLAGVSPMRLHQEIGMTRKSAWFMLQRLRQAAESGDGLFVGVHAGEKRSAMRSARRSPRRGKAWSASGSGSVT